MSLRVPPAILGLVISTALAGVAPAHAYAQDQEKEKAGATAATGESPAAGASKDQPKAEVIPKIDKAIFGGGCFWCTEAVFERIPGVKSVVSGYAGGHVPNPSYQDVCTGLTGHAEVVMIVYDSSVVSFEKLLNVFWKSHDPTTLNQQGDDFGTQYRSIILYTTEAQKQAALKSYHELKARRAFRDPIVTQLEPLKAFYAAEEYHQDYYNNHRGSPYTDYYIAPKLRKLKLKQ
jgi:peptide-methionine (S)-S-oxide reductase